VITGSYGCKDLNTSVNRALHFLNIQKPVSGKKLGNIVFTLHFFVGAALPSLLHMFPGFLYQRNLSRRNKYSGAGKDAGSNGNTCQVKFLLNWR